MKIPTWVNRGLWRWTTACLLPSAAVMVLAITMTKPTKWTFILWGVAMAVILVVILAVESAED